MVQFVTNEGSDSVLADLTITGGNASEPFPAVDGGGILCDFASPTLSNCVIRDNLANDDGAGMYSEDGSPTLIDYVFNNNVAVHWSGGLYLLDATPAGTPASITRCRFVNNQST